MTITHRLSASTVALALAASAITVPSAFAADTEAPATLASGAVNWSIKESFNKYVKMPFAQGSITTDGEIVENDNSFDFAVNPEQSELDSDGNGFLQLSGAIHYEAHEGQLDLKYSDIKIQIENGTEATITADYDLQGALPGQEASNESVQDAEISSFELNEALIPEFEKVYEQSGLKTSFLQGAADSLLNYPTGPVEDGDVDLTVTFAEKAEGQPTPQPKPNTPDANPAQSSDLDASSKGGIIAAIIAIVAAIGAAVGGFIPGIDFGRLDLKQFGF